LRRDRWLKEFVCLGSTVTLLRKEKTLIVDLTKERNTTREEEVEEEKKGQESYLETGKAVDLRLRRRERKIFVLFVVLRGFVKGRPMMGWSMLCGEPVGSLFVEKEKEKKKETLSVFFRFAVWLFSRPPFLFTIRVCINTIQKLAPTRILFERFLDLRNTLLWKNRIFRMLVNRLGEPTDQKKKRTTNTNPTKLIQPTMSCCGGDAPPPRTAALTQPLPYKYLFKYIIVGDTGSFFSPAPLKWILLS
jgi:hypothetical protein